MGLIFIKDGNIIKYDSKTNEAIWTTSAGKSIKVSEMATTHIINSIKKIKSSGGWRQEWLPILENELKRRNLSLSSENDSELKGITTTKEMKYFLETSCDYITVTGKELVKQYKGDSNTVKDYLYNKDSIFSISRDEFKTNLEFAEFINKLNPENIYSKTEKYRLENVFTKEWKLFIDIMLGRRK